MLIWRSTHEALLAAKDAEARAWEARFWAQTAKHEVLLDTYVALLSAPAPAPVLAPRVRREPDAADTAIEWAAQGDIPKRRYLERWAKLERAKGRDGEAIATEIMRGATDSGDDDGIPA